MPIDEVVRRAGIEINARVGRADRAGKRDRHGRDAIRVRAIAQIAVDHAVQANLVLRPLLYDVGEAGIGMPARDTKGEGRDNIARRRSDAQGLLDVAIEVGIAREGEVVAAATEAEDHAGAARHREDMRVMRRREGEAAGGGQGGRRRLCPRSGGGREGQETEDKGEDRATHT